MLQLPGHSRRQGFLDDFACRPLPIPSHIASHRSGPLALVGNRPVTVVTLILTRGSSTPLSVRDASGSGAAKEPGYAAELVPGSACFRSSQEGQRGGVPGTVPPQRQELHHGAGPYEGFTRAASSSNLVAGSRKRHKQSRSAMCMWFTGHCQVRPVRRRVGPQRVLLARGAWWWKGGSSERVGRAVDA